jgi:F0F1-type ATP synthase membrane subunit b/b'
MNDMTSMAEFLKVYGGWGVAVVAIIGLVALYRHTGKLLESRNDLIVDILRDATANVEQCTKTNEKVESLLVENLRILELVKEKLKRSD